ncbi:hypothetical protein GJ496_010906 [Pomphorhynchus laevis]|nr:hypothetical protein GJ496_010906 [Pomphorhynchus laevis]
MKQGQHIVHSGINTNQIRSRARTETYVGSDSVRDICACEGNTQLDDAIPRNIDGSSTGSSLSSMQRPAIKRGECKFENMAYDTVAFAPVNYRYVMFRPRIRLMLGLDRSAVLITTMPPRAESLSRSLIAVVSYPSAVNAWFALLAFAKSILHLPNDSSGKNGTGHCFDDQFVMPNSEKLQHLKHMHPAKMSQAAGERGCCETSQTGDARDSITVVSRGSVPNAIRSFSNASAGGTDGLSPVHLKDLVSVSSGATGPLLVDALCQFCRVLLDATVHPCIRPIIFGSRLLAFRNKCGGLRPIAIGCTLRRLAAKIANIRTCELLANSFTTHQLGLQ